MSIGFPRARPLIGPVEFNLDLPGAQGRVVEADADDVVLDINGTRRRFSYPALGTGKIQIEFDRRDEAPGPGEPDGH